MADPLAIIGLVSAIVQFVDFGSKIVGRLNEYREAGNNVPKTFQSISLSLPLVIDNLKRTKDQANADEISNETANALKPVLEASLLHTQQLERLLEKTLPVEGDSTWRRGKKAISSLTDWKAVQKIMSELDSHLKHLSYFLTLNGSTPSGQTVLDGTPQSLLPNTQGRLQPCFMVRFARDKNFVGREDIIKEINRRFLDRQPCIAIAGIGGVGKSQIAVEYCYRYRQEHPEAHIFWVHASTTARFAVGYQRLGEELALTDVNNPDVDTIELVQKWLSNDANGPWLLVLDNADDIETVFGSEDAEEQTGALFNHLPQSLNGSIIVTTRDRRIGQRLAPLEKPIVILPFEKEDAKHLLQKMLHENDLEEYSMALLEALGFLPMAITQAAAFIRENSISLREYLSFLRAGDNQAKNLLAITYYDPGRDRESQNSVFQTWKISFDCVRKQNPRAASILALMAVFDRQAIPKTLLCNDNESEVDFAIAIGALKAFSLVGEEQSKGAFGMHRLIQLSTQKWLEHEGVIIEWQKKAIIAISKTCNANHPFIDDWKTWRSISPHARVVLGYDFQNEPFLLERALIWHRLALHELEEGYIVNANVRAQEALTTIQKLEEDHPKKLAIAITMASVLYNQGKFDASEKILQQVFEERQARLGPNHAESLLSLQYVADSLAMQKKYQEAEALLRQVVEAWTKLPELATHSFRFSCYVSLACTLAVQSKHEEAEKSIRKALDGTAEVFGTEHPFTAITLAHLSSILKAQGKYEAAEAIARRALHIHERILGPQHRHTLIVLATLASILEMQDKFEEAERLSRRACDTLESLVGIEHPETIIVLDSLACILVKRKKYQEAEAALRKGGRDRQGTDYEAQSKIAGIGCLAHVLMMQGKFGESELLRRRELNAIEHLHGSEHIESVEPLMGLAYVLNKQANYEEAEVVARQALRISADKFGPEHRQPLAALANLVIALGGQAKYAEQEVVSLRAFRGFEVTSVPTDLNAIACLAHIAMEMVKQGKFEATEDMCRPLLDGYQEAWGSEHPGLMSLIYYFAEALANLGKYEEAEVLNRRISKLYEAEMGFEHPTTIATLQSLTFILDKQEKYEAAEAVRRRVLEWLEKELGPDHEFTAMAVYGLAWTLHAQSDYDQASVLYQRALAGLSKTSGPDHEVAVACLEGLATLKIIRQNQKLSNPKYFPRLKRLIRYLLRQRRALTDPTWRVVAKQ